MSVKRIRPEQIQYTIDEANRIVTAEATSLGLDALDIATLGLSAWKAGTIAHDESNSESQAINIPDTLQGVAHCHPDDEWDVEVGKSIARKRLYRKYDEEKARVGRAYARKLQTYVNRKESK